jgi:hypothetical protein
MRVQYTLPGYQPELQPAPQTEEAAGPSFSAQMRMLQRHDTTTWIEALKLDRSPFEGTSIGPPPQPSSLEIRDPAAEHHRWRQLLERHNLETARSNGEGSERIRNMMLLLTQAQHAADAVMSRSFEGER